MDKKIVKENKLTWWQIILLIIAFYFLWSLIFEDSEYCIDECVRRMDSCSYSSAIEGKNFIEYIPDEDFDSCLSSLKYCLYDC